MDNKQNSIRCVAKVMKKGQKCDFGQGKNSVQKMIQRLLTVLWQHNHQDRVKFGCQASAWTFLEERPASQFPLRKRWRFAQLMASSILKILDSRANDTRRELMWITEKTIIQAYDNVQISDPRRK